MGVAQCGTEKKNGSLATAPELTCIMRSKDGGNGHHQCISRQRFHVCFSDADNLRQTAALFGGDIQLSNLTPEAAAAEEEEQQQQHEEH